MKNNKEVKTTHAPPQDSLKVCERNFFSHVLTNSERYIKHETSLFKIQAAIY